MSNDRDRIIEQALKHELASGRTPVAEPCLDAETLAAWMDGGLDPNALAAAEAHASHCERCQATLSTVIKTLPAAGPLADGTRARGTLSFWWFAPLAAGAAAVTLWMVVPQQSVQEPVSPAIVASRETAPPPAVEAPQQPAAPAESRRNVPAAESPQRLADAAKTTDTVAAAPPPRDQQAKAEAGQRADVATPERTRAEANLARESKVAEPAAAAELGAAAVAPPAAPALQKRMQQSALVEVVSPDPSRRWRAAAEGAIERSNDGGRTWTPVRLPGDAAITAGASPSPGVCWLVGAGGLVLLAVDGTTFVRLPFPEAIDLAGVTAVDARSATVTAADGRTFQTTDSGRTWRRR